jgi:Uma2 family endonuclease
MTASPAISSASDLPLITLFAHGDADAVSIPSSAYSLRGFRDWALSESFPDRGRFSFVGGELIIDMSPEFFETHNAVKVEITSVVYRLVKELRLGHVFGDRSLLSNEVANISTEPDAMFASYSSFQTGRCRILDSPRPGVAQELAGTPDWVLEIVSKTSKLKDTRMLREGYFAAGIAEYWLVDALGQEIDFQILVPGTDGYATIDARNGWLESPTFRRGFQLRREKDQEGIWLYTLQVRENA